MSVLIFSTEQTDETNLNLLSDDRPTVGKVELQDLKKNLDEMGPAIDGVVDAVKSAAAAKGLSEITLAIGINAKGKVGFLGTGSEVGGTATLTLKFSV